MNHGLRTVLLVALMLAGCGGGKTQFQLDGKDPETTPDANQEDRLSGDATPDLAGFDLELAFPETTDLPPQDALGCQPGEGCFADPCSQDSDCDSGFCVNHMGNRVCTKWCVEDCPHGWSCQQHMNTWPDVVFVCVSDFPLLCLPCNTDDDCFSLAGVKNRCLDHGGKLGSFCGGLCDDLKHCPDGFECTEVAMSDGALSTQCLPAGGECACSDMAVDLALSTGCADSNEFGVCEGTRTCGSGGLTECGATVPALELCDGIDNDCDGILDEETCDDGSFCTADTCAGEAGCILEPLSGEPCDDGDTCSSGDICFLGECTGTVISCDDEDVCTDDSCDTFSGCLHEFNQAACDDGDPCTIADECDAGNCDGVPVECDCLTDADCAPFEDGNVCNGTLLCDQAKVPYQCAIKEGSAVKCPKPEGINAPCLEPACNPLTGACALAQANDGVACSDGDSCTFGELCAAGACGGGMVLNCNDGNPCTSDSCAADTGCEYANNDLPCDDGNKCTVGDICQAGGCLPGDAAGCDDGNLCTDDHCEPAVGCVHVPNAVPCDDGNDCTVADHCTNGWCIGGAPPECNDGNPCTTDLCEPDGGCLNVPNQFPCDDGDPCTDEDVCAEGECHPGEQVDCNDGNLCTDDVCHPQKGCVNSPNQDPCDDGNHCTLDDQCANSWCAGGPPPVCNDGNPCTDDSCSPATGCVFGNNELPCDDGDECTLGDSCLEGQCGAGAMMLDCNDDNVCTDDSCSPELGCINADNTLPCDDNNACTTADQCGGGWCLGGPPPDCDDGNPCTADSCTIGAGCLNNPNSLPCDDSDDCTMGDVCGGGTCLPGAPLDCDDGNTCTADSCLPDSGCVNANNDLPCPDGLCLDGVCTCLPDCGGLDCGPDGCGGTCGSCQDSYSCQAGVCVYQPACGNGQCDADTETCLNCPQDCGCALGQVCDAGICLSCPDFCTAHARDCDFFQGCDCGDCGCGETCQQWTCVFLNCTGKTCGDDGCGGSCGECQEDYSCKEGTCLPDYPESCLKILELGLSNGDGAYKIKPPGLNVAVDVVCDMSTDGGGWTLVARLTDSDSLNWVRRYNTQMSETLWFNGQAYGTLAGQADYKNEAFDTLPLADLLLTAHAKSDEGLVFGVWANGIGDGANPFPAQPVWSTPGCPHYTPSTALLSGVLGVQPGGGYVHGMVLGPRDSNAKTTVCVKNGAVPGVLNDLANGGAGYGPPELAVIALGSDAAGPSSNPNPQGFGNYGNEGYHDFRGLAQGTTIYNFGFLVEANYGLIWIRE